MSGAEPAGAGAGREGSAESPGSWHAAVTEASLFSYLVTRHTGRAVRLSIESQIAARREPEGVCLLTILDFRSVAVIDFSCADEVVAKLVHRALPVGGAGPECYFLFRGIGEHHLDPVQSALERRSLAVVAERAGGERVLLGRCDSLGERVWGAVTRMEVASTSGLSRELSLSPERTERILGELHARRLVVRAAGTYLSLPRALREASSYREESG